MAQVATERNEYLPQDVDSPGESEGGGAREVAQDVSAVVSIDKTQGGADIKGVGKEVGEVKQGDRKRGKTK